METGLVRNVPSASLNQVIWMLTIFRVLIFDAVPNTMHPGLRNMLYFGYKMQVLT